MLVSSITLISAASAAFCLRYNTQDCRDFSLQSFLSDGIENQLTIGTTANMPAELADDFAGLWYMNGNPLPDEILSFAGVKKDEKKGDYFARVYDEKIWTWSDNISGRLLYEAVRTTALTYRIKKVNSTAYHVTPTFFLPPYLLNLPISISDAFVEFLIVRTADPNLWARPSKFFGKSVGAYEFTRIVYANGTRTEKYAQNYLSNIDSKAPGITLERTQLVPFFKPKP
jgi:hypothetical protein